MASSLLLSSNVYEPVDGCFTVGEITLSKQKDNVNTILTALEQYKLSDTSVVFACQKSCLKKFMGKDECSVNIKIMRSTPMNSSKRLYYGSLLLKSFIEKFSAEKKYASALDAFFSEKELAWLKANTGKVPTCFDGKRPVNNKDLARFYTKIVL